MDTLAGWLQTVQHLMDVFFFFFWRLWLSMFSLHSCPTCCWTAQDQTPGPACTPCSSERASRSIPNQSKKSSEWTVMFKDVLLIRICRLVHFIWSVFSCQHCHLVIRFKAPLPSHSPGVIRRSSMTQTSITGTRCIALRFLQPPPTARQWWRCATALGGATSPRCTWSRGRGPSATRAPPSSTRNTPRTLTAPRSTTTPRAPAAGLSPRCSWSRVRILVPVSSTQRTCRPQSAPPA